MLAEHERKGIEYRAKRDAKKHKKSDRDDEETIWKNPGYDIPFDTLPALCIEKVFSYIDSPQDLFNVSFSSKLLMSLVNPEMVIRSAVFNNLRKRDTRNRKTMASIMSYMTSRSIHIPSAHRMLRLLNAKSCERGDMCWGKNLVTGKPMAIEQTMSCRPFGLAICTKCVKYGTTNIPYSHFSRFQQGVAFHTWNKLMDPQVDPRTGEANGSLVKVIELQQIESSFSQTEDRKEALEAMVVRAIETSGKYCPSHYEDVAASYCEMFDASCKEADDYIHSEQMKEHQKYVERRDERVAKRLQRVRGIYNQVEELLADCPMKEIALSCTWREDDTDCLRFKCNIVNQNLMNIVSAPVSDVSIFMLWCDDYVVPSL
eukprot:scaffold1967_cov199-Alexandrium_tamarense.AAC.23